MAVATAGGEPTDAVFAALADGTRRRILASVAEHGPVTATALASRFPVTRQAVAKHLALLRDAGLVTAERAGRETRFTAVPTPLDELARWAAATGRRWDDRLARLRSGLAADPAAPGRSAPPTPDGHRPGRATSRGNA